MSEVLLRVTAGPAAGAEIPLEDELHIGREAEESGRLGDDPEISRRHARLRRDPDGEIVVEDLGSTNGTYLNGERIHGPRMLQSGDVLQLGTTELKFMSLRAPVTKTADVPVMAPPTVVSARDLVRRYGEGEAAVTALNGVSVDIDRGKLTAVMGPSGSGKSTLMHILAGLDRPTSGVVTIDGTDIGALGDNELTKLRRQSIGFIFQFFNLLPMLTAEENVVLPLSIAGRKADRAVLDEMLERVGLSDRRGHRPSELSGGQQQRVAIARAFVSQPAVVFADEPTGNLDSKSSAEIQKLMRESVEDYGQTTVMVTHDAHAATIADRVLFIADGQIVRDVGRSTAPEILEAMEDLGG